MSETRDALQNLAARIKALGLHVFEGCDPSTKEAIEWFSAELSVSNLEVGDERAHFVCVCPDCAKPRDAEVDYHLSRNNSVAVADALTYLPMDTCPLGVKVLLLNLGGVATLGVVKRENRSEWRGWFPLPKERKMP